MTYDEFWYISPEDKTIICAGIDNIRKIFDDGDLND